jgi:hypothetical protein
MASGSHDAQLQIGICLNFVTTTMFPLHKNITNHATSKGMVAIPGNVASLIPSLPSFSQVTLPLEWNNELYSLTSLTPNIDPKRKSLILNGSKREINKLQRS